MSEAGSTSAQEVDSGQMACCDQHLATVQGSPKRAEKSAGSPRATLPQDPSMTNYLTTFEASLENALSLPEASTAVTAK
jgi:hypothetical protein